MNQIKAVIFDFGRVIGNFDHIRICNKLAVYSDFCLGPEEIYHRIFDSGLDRKFNQGRITPWDFFLEIKKAIGTNESLTYHSLREIWGDIFSPNPGIEKVLERIRIDINMILLSNTNAIHWDWIRQIPAVKRFFCSSSKLILSFMTGFAKPDPEIFQMGIKKADCEPSKIVYVDDIPECVEAFKSLGGNGIVYDCTKDKIDVLESVLNRFGVLA